MINSRRHGFNQITHFNNFNVSDYILMKDKPSDYYDDIMRRLSLCELSEDFDDATFDPMYCGIVVALILANEKLGVFMKQISFNMDTEAAQKANQEEEERLQKP